MCRPTVSHFHKDTKLDYLPTSLLNGYPQVTLRFYGRTMSNPPNLHPSPLPYCQRATLDPAKYGLLATGGRLNESRSRLPSAKCAFLKEDTDAASAFFSPASCYVKVNVRSGAAATLLKPRGNKPEDEEPTWQRQGWPASLACRPAGEARPEIAASGLLDTREPHDLLLEQSGLVLLATHTAPPNTRAIT